MQSGETARVRYDTDPRTGTLTYDSAACLNHLKLNFSNNVSQCHENIGRLRIYQADGSVNPVLSKQKKTQTERCSVSTVIASS